MSKSFQQFIQSQDIAGYTCEYQINAFLCNIHDVEKVDIVIRRNRSMVYRFMVSQERVELKMPDWARSYLEKEDEETDRQEQEAQASYIAFLRKRDRLAGNTNDIIYDEPLSANTDHY